MIEDETKMSGDETEMIGDDFLSPSSGFRPQEMRGEEAKRLRRGEERKRRRKPRDMRDSHE